MAKPNAVIALSDAEIQDFFPGELWSDLQQLLPGARRFPVPAPDPQAWPGLWRNSPAEMLITGWQTPSLNSTVSAADLRPLRYVCHLAGTVRKLIPRELIGNGLVVTNWGAAISGTVAECALMLILMALRRASHWSIAMHREGAWKDSSVFTQSLIDRRVGIHGFGAISQRLVPMIRPFTDRITAFSPQVPDRILIQYGVARAASLNDLFATSDVVVELAAGTPQNFHIVTEELLRSIPDGGVFVNVGRGNVVDETALIRVATEGRLQVALDVFETEPLPPDSPLRGLPNVTLLPHLGGPTRDRRRDSGQLALKNIRAWLHGEPLEALVTLDVYDRAS
jgi:phosphoglycerate dehydrogenase-like enzyme